MIPHNNLVADVTHIGQADEVIDRCRALLLICRAADPMPGVSAEAYRLGCGLALEAIDDALAYLGELFAPGAQQEEGQC